MYRNMFWVARTFCTLRLKMLKIRGSRSGMEESRVQGGFFLYSAFQGFSIT